MSLTEFPLALDTFDNPSVNVSQNNVTTPHSQQHAKINDAMAAVQEVVGITGSLDTNSHEYRISVLESAVISDWKSSVRAVATSNITLSGAQTIDGVSVVAGNRVLVAGQTTAANNGIYVCAAGAWSRATDADSSAEVTAGMLVVVTEGTTYADTIWQLTTNDTINLGVTSLAFSQVDATLATLAGNGLSVSGAGLAVNTDGSTLEISSDNLRIKDAGVTEAKIGLSDNTTNDVSSTKHGFTPKSPADATKFLNGAATPAWAQVKDSDLSTSDITTNDVSTSKHGFAPKAPNAAWKFLDGTGAWNPVGQPIYLTSDTTFSATTTVANVTGMSWSVVSGGTYTFRFVLVVQSDTATTGVRVTLTTPTFTIFSAMVYQVVGADGASSLGNFYCGSITSSGDEVATSAVPTTGTDYLLVIEGSIVPSANGTLQLKGACEVASGNVKIRQGSYGELKRAA